MNLWIVAMGPQGLPKRTAQDIKAVAAGYDTLTHNELLEWKQADLHYLSCHTDAAHTCKRYHHAPDPETLYAYCGLPLDPSAETDPAHLRDAARLPDFLPEAHQRGEGVFALLRLDRRGLLCLGDPLGAQKIFIHQPGPGQTYLSNDINLLLRLKPKTPDLRFFLQRAVLGHATGDLTCDAQIRRLPMYGRIKYANGTTRIESTRPIHEITEIQGDWNHWIHRLGQEYRATAKALYKAFPLVHGQSGGFDSRLMLLMFQGLDLRGPRFRSFSFNSGIGLRDVRLSARLARSFGMEHRKVIMPPEPPRHLEGFMDRSRELCRPFRSFDRVLYDTLSPRIADLFSPDLHVYTFGSDGAVEPLTRLCLRPWSGTRMRQAIEWYAKTDLLRPQAAESFLQELEAETLARYQNVDTDRSKAMCYIFELYRNDPIGLHHKTRDLFPPFYFSGFLELLFLCTDHQRTKRNTGSFYHRLAEAIAPGRVPDMEFTEFCKWGASPWEKRLLRLKNKARDRFVGRVKFELQLKTAFLSQNADELGNLVRRHWDSPLFQYFDAEKVRRCLEDEQSRGRHAGTLCKLLPALAYVDGQA